MSLVDVWQAIADACSNLTGVNCTAYEPAEPVVPALFPLLADIGQYGTYQHGEPVDFTLKVRLLVNQIDELLRTENILPYLDPTGEQSVKKALEADPTLSGTVEALTVTGWVDLGRFIYGSIQYLGVDFTVEVLCSE